MGLMIVPCPRSTLPVSMVIWLSSLRRVPVRAKRPTRAAPSGLLSERSASRTTGPWMYRVPWGDSIRDIPPRTMGRLVVKPWRAKRVLLSRRIGVPVRPSASLFCASRRTPPTPSRPSPRLFGPRSSALPGPRRRSPPSPSRDPSKMSVLFPSRRSRLPGRASGMDSVRERSSAGTWLGLSRARVMSSSIPPWMNPRLGIGPGGRKPGGMVPAGMANPGGSTLFGNPPVCGVLTGESGIVESSAAFAELIVKEPARREARLVKPSKRWILCGMVGSLLVAGPFIE